MGRRRAEEVTKASSRRLATAAASPTRRRHCIPPSTAFALQSPGTHYFRGPAAAVGTAAGPAHAGVLRAPPFAARARARTHPDVRALALLEVWLGRLGGFACDRVLFTLIKIL